MVEHVRRRPAQRRARCGRFPPLDPAEADRPCRGTEMQAGFDRQQEQIARQQEQIADVQKQIALQTRWILAKLGMTEGKADLAPLKNDVGSLEGSDLEMRVHRSIRPLLHRHLQLRRARVMQSAFHQERAGVRGFGLRRGGFRSHQCRRAGRFHPSAFQLAGGEPGSGHPSVGGRAPPAGHRPRGGGGDPAGRRLAGDRHRLEVDVRRKTIRFTGPVSGTAVRDGETQAGEAFAPSDDGRRGTPEIAALPDPTRAPAPRTAGSRSARRGSRQVRGRPERAA